MRFDEKDTVKLAGLLVDDDALFGTCPVNALSLPLTLLNTSGENDISLL